MLRLRDHSRGATCSSRRKYTAVVRRPITPGDGTTGRFRPALAMPPSQQDPTQNSPASELTDSAGSNITSSADPPVQHTNRDGATAVNAAGDWGPLRWMRLRWSGGGAGATGGQPPNSSSVPEVSVSLSDAASQPIFELLYRLYLEHGPIFRMKLGPKSFYVISDPSYAKQIFVSSVDKYGKGILAEILEFVMGKGLLSADGEHWAARRKAVAPALQRKFVSSQVALFAAATRHGMVQLEAAAAAGGSLDMESFFSRLSLDVVGKAIFDYEFDSLTHDDPVIQAVYAVLLEAEARSTAPFPYWKLPGASLLVPRLRTSAAALRVVNDTLDRLVAQCKAMVDADGQQFPAVIEDDDSDAASTSSTSSSSYSYTSVLQFLLASGEPIGSRQLRDDLMTLIIAGHETTAAALTWALHLLAARPEAVARLRQEVDSVLGDRLPSSAADLAALRYTTRVVCEALRLYPQPPVLFRRAEQEDVLGGVHVIPPGSDLFISVWNLHHSPQLWEQPEEFRPERFGPLEGPQPSEANTDYRYMPFGGGRRKCVGDQFALMQATTALALLLRRYDFRPDPAKPPVGLTTGATIHTTAGLHMLVTHRDMAGVPPPQPPAASASAAIGGCPHAAAAAVAASAATVVAAAPAASGCPHAAAAVAAAASAPANVPPLKAAAAPDGNAADGGSGGSTA